MSDTFKQYLTLSQQRTHEALKQVLADQRSTFCLIDSRPLTHHLFEAMRYSVMNGGKRVRPLLLFATADALHAPDFLANSLDLLACALEFIHCYSLVHDDLPAMDNDDLRRGKPTCHRAYDEATAILVGDALQAEAFTLLAHCQDLDPAIRIRLVSALAQASGAGGMVGGQAIDLAAVNQQIDLAHLEAMHRLKTGALIRASVSMAAIACQASDAQQRALDDYAVNIGLAFQVRDDILDVESDTLTLGKAQGADQARNKPTYPALLGMAGAKQKLLDLHHNALNALSNFDAAAITLRQLADFIVNRKH